jgi:hypothetical protein
MDRALFRSLNMANEAGRNVSMIMRQKAVDFKLSR